jgi:DsbC/DsbD-like thiol-disulfide interchange protein
MLRLLVIAAVALIAAAPPAEAADPARYMTAELIAESTAPLPGSTILVGIRFTPRPGWHGYWSNPGDSGIAPTVRWSAPEGVHFGPLLHSAPVLLTADGVSNFVHEDPHVLVSRMRIPASIRQGAAIPIAAELNWAACTATQCVPLHTTLTLQLAAGHGSKGGNWPDLNAAVLDLPRRAPAGTFVQDGRSMRFLVPATLDLDPRSTRFFPDQGGTFDTAAARVEQFDGSVTVKAPLVAHVSGSISGVLSDGRNAYRLSFTQAESSTAAQAPVVSKTEQPPRESIAASRSLRRSDSPGSSDDPEPRSQTLSWWLLATAAAMLAAALVLVGRFWINRGWAGTRRRDPQERR